jgi:hypothetical protein
MGHSKGTMKRKLPKDKVKPLATANRGGGTVSGLIHSENTGAQLPGKARAMPLGKGGMNPSSGSNKGSKRH